MAKRKKRSNARISVFQKHKLPFHTLSWGLGLQSTAMIAKILAKELPRPDCIIFADPKWEVEGSYDTLDYMKPLIDKAGIPLHIVSAGNIREEGITSGRTELPYFVNASRYETIEGKMKLLVSDTRRAWYKAKKQQERGNVQVLFPEAELSLEETIHHACTEFGKKVRDGVIKSGWMQMDTSQIGRQCTKKYKIQAVMKFLRKNYNVSLKKQTGQWLGITTDEWTRMTTSEIKASVLMYPLIDLGMSRDDCEDYLNEQGLPIPPKSTCKSCPYHSDKTWRELSDADIDDCADFEEGVIQMIANDPILKYLPYFANGARVHPSMVPIGERPFEKETGEVEEDGTPCMGNSGCFL